MSRRKPHGALGGSLSEAEAKMMSSLMEQVLLITHMLSRVSSMVGTLKGRCTYEKADVARQAESPRRSCQGLG